MDNFLLNKNNNNNNNYLFRNIIRKIFVALLLKSERFPKKKG